MKIIYIMVVAQLFRELARMNIVAQAKMPVYTLRFHYGKEKTTYFNM